MPHLRVKLHLGWNVRILFGNLNVDLELSPLVACVNWSVDYRLPVVEAIVNKPYLILCLVTLLIMIIG